MALEGGSAVDSLLQASLCSVNPLAIADVSSVTASDVKAAGMCHVVYLRFMLYYSMLSSTAMHCDCAVFIQYVIVVVSTEAKFFVSLKVI